MKCIDRDDELLIKLRERICARRGTVQHQTKVLYFVALKFAANSDYHIVIDNAQTLFMYDSLEEIPLYYYVASTCFHDESRNLFDC